MNYTYAALMIAWIGIAGLMAASGQMEPRHANCSEAKKGSIVAVVNCPDLAEVPAQAPVAISERDRASALARARGAPQP